MAMSDFPARPYNDSLPHYHNAPRYRGWRQDEIPELGYFRAEDSPMVNTPMSPFSEDYEYEETYERAEGSADLGSELHGRDAGIHSRANMRRVMGAPSLDPRYLSNMVPPHVVYPGQYLFYPSEEESLWRRNVDHYNTAHMPKHMMDGSPTDHLDTNHNNNFYPFERAMPAGVRALNGEAQNMFGQLGSIGHDKQPRREQRYAIDRSLVRDKGRRRDPRADWSGDAWLVPCPRPWIQEADNSPMNMLAPPMYGRKGMDGMRRWKEDNRAMPIPAAPVASAGWQRPRKSYPRYERNGGHEWYLASAVATQNGQKISLEEMFSGTTYLDHVGELGHCQVSCRMLQQKLESSQENFDRIFVALMKPSEKEAFSQFVELMVDPFGNYLCQKIMEYSSIPQLEQLQRATTPHILHICLSSHGSRAMQKYIEIAVNKLPKHVLKDFCDGVAPEVVTLVCSQVGNHVIARLLKLMPQKSRAFIYAEMEKHVRKVATNRYGCCVLQRCMDICDTVQKHQLCVEICNNSLYLIQDPYGNYAVQYVISQKMPKEKDEPASQERKNSRPTSSYCALVCDQIVDHLGMLAMQKFSSNVIERCLEGAPTAKLQKMLGEISKPATLSMLVKDSFGNYVVQSALNVAQGAELETLLSNMGPFLSNVEGPYLQKRVRRKLIKKYPFFAAKGGGRNGDSPQWADYTVSPQETALPEPLESVAV